MATWSHSAQPQVPPSSNVEEAGQSENRRKRMRHNSPPRAPREPQPVQPDVGTQFAEGNFSQQEALMAGRPEVWNEGVADEVVIDLFCDEEGLDTKKDNEDEGDK